MVAPADLLFTRTMIVDWEFCHDHVHVFELHLQAEPRLRIDNREVVAAQFIEPRALLAEVGVSPVIRAYLEDWSHAPQSGTTREGSTKL